MSHATHANAALTLRARRRIARLIVEDGWRPARAAERFGVSWRTANKWADRYRDEGPAGMVDRSLAPRRQPNRTPAPVVRKIVHLRCKQRLGPVEIADRLHMASSTVHAVLVRCQLNRLYTSTTPRLRSKSIGVSHPSWLWGRVRCARSRGTRRSRWQTRAECSTSSGRAAPPAYATRRIRS